jgi:hypothetical protein
VDAHPVSGKIAAEETLVCWNKYRPGLDLKDFVTACGSHQGSDFVAFRLVCLSEGRKNRYLPSDLIPFGLISMYLQLFCRGSGLVCKVVHLLRRRVYSSRPDPNALHQDHSCRYMKLVG